MMQRSNPNHRTFRDKLGLHKIAPAKAILGIAIVLGLCFYAWNWLDRNCCKMIGLQLIFLTLARRLAWHMHIRLFGNFISMAPTLKVSLDLSFTLTSSLLA
jgi:hypothetical protein